jgi:3-hydroxyacyl-[acyl-carrier-protein] dehydratase
MPSAPLIDLTTLDLTRLVMTRDEIYAGLPHRFEFMQLDGIVHIDRENRIGVGLRTVRDNEFWVRGHIPGRPLMPGVLMIEAAAQMASVLSMQLMTQEGFLGFGGVDAVKFRKTVKPPATMYIVEKVVDLRRRRTICDAQSFVNGELVFEGRITGMQV